MRFKRLADKWRAINASIPEREKEFEPVAEERIAEAPFAFYVGLPFLRSALLWLEMPNVSYAQLQYVGRWTTASDRPNAKNPGPLRAVWQSGKHRDRIAKSLQQVRRRPSRLHPLHVVRRRRSLRVHAADSRPHRPKGRQERVCAVFAARDGRTRNRVVAGA